MDYQAWGQAREIIADAASKAGIRNPFRFQGQYQDEESGLHYNRHRYYDPEIGRFISRDPIGLMGGVNIHSYAMNPVEWVDPLGLKPCFANKQAEDKASQIIKKHGGTQTGENRFSMPNRRAARQAASEIAGDLGSDRRIIRKPEFRGGPYTWQSSKGRIGATNAGETAGWRDDVLGHPELGAGPHVNAWNDCKGIYKNLHLDY